MSTVERQNGKIEDSEMDGNTIINITLTGIVPTTEDMLDRMLQQAMIETGVDTAWQVAPPPTAPDVVPAEPTENPTTDVQVA